MKKLLILMMLLLTILTSSCALTKLTDEPIQPHAVAQTFRNEPFRYIYACKQGKKIIYAYSNVLHPIDKPVKVYTNGKVFIILNPKH